MAVIQVGKMLKSHCRHGSREGTCRYQDCEYWNQLPQNDVRNVFGRESSAQLAQDLYKRSHNDTCTPDTPCQYHAQKNEARAKGIIAF
jgi:hypothetical protein